jgi:hypothetical protein
MLKRSRSRRVESTEYAGRRGYTGIFEGRRRDRPRDRRCRHLCCPTTAMGITVAISTERDQVFVCVVTQSTSRANVVDLETIGTAAILASPSITFQHFDAKFAIRICVEPKSRSPWSEITH